MDIHLTAEYLEWANQEQGEVTFKINGQRVFSIPVAFDAGPKEPQIEAAVFQWVFTLAKAHGALSW